MAIIDLLNSKKTTAFSYEILPPIKGTGVDDLLQTVERLKEFNPQYINITTHQSEYEYRQSTLGSYERKHLKRRPGTVAIAASIQYKTGIPVIPHILCEGYSKEDTEYALLDLNYLGVTNLLLLRGDKVKGMNSLEQEGTNCNKHTTDLQNQVNNFNKGLFIDGSRMEHKPLPFSYGVACYPEKHEEAPNLERDLFWLKQKQDLGATYAVTQMFYDNKKFFEFVDKARLCGITIPIIPGLKPLKTQSQLNMLPRVFNIDIPESLVKEVEVCKNNKEVQQVGIEWCIEQCRELIAHRVSSLHFYSMGRADDIYAVAKEIF